MKVHHIVAALAASAFACGVSAQNLKPGLWEITSKTKSSSGDMEKAQAQAQEQFAKMPPEERRKMEEMMAKHGVKMGAGPGSGTRICMSKEMVERNEPPVQQGDCKTTKHQRSGNTTRMSFTCANPPSSGEGEYTVVSPEAYTSKTRVTSTVQGKADTMNMETSGKWIGADCGTLKPIQTGKAK